jgi:hypothetical protein
MSEPPVPLPPKPQRPGAESGPTELSVTAWFADISNIDSAAQTFTANLFLLFRWQDPRLVNSETETKAYAAESLWHPQWLIVNASSSMKRTFPETIDVAPDGSAVYRQRVLGSFSQPLDLHRFPFDSASFRVDIVVPGHRPEDIHFIADEAAVAAGMKMGVGIADDITLQDWRVTSVSARARPYVATPGVELAGYRIGFTADRKAQHYVLKVILPLVLIVMMSWAVFWIDPTMANPQVAVAITSMLTLIAYRFSIGSEVPKLSYLTALDAFILTSTILVFFSLVEVVITATLAVRGRVDAALTIDRYSRWLFPCVFAIALATIFSS